MSVVVVVVRRVRSVLILDFQVEVGHLPGVEDDVRCCCCDVVLEDLFVLVVAQGDAEEAVEEGGGPGNEGRVVGGIFCVDNTLLDGRDDVVAYFEDDVVDELVGGFGQVLRGARGVVGAALPLVPEGCPGVCDYLEVARLAAGVGVKAVGLVVIGCSDLLSRRRRRHAQDFVAVDELTPPSCADLASPSLGKRALLGRHEERHHHRQMHGTRIAA
mmetsp:Transcript_29003/g.93521  ORF Transcript_29003/g.93521 Transcript_29003/m.93521 type:complete len:215 (-) Transcript_29003:60-704(-)